MTFEPHIPTESELTELALQIFFEENPQATTNPEEYELRAPEGSYYLKARARAMTGIKEELYRALEGYQQETENVLASLKELGEKPEGYASDEELEKQITTLNNKLARTERKLESAEKNIETLTAEKAALDETMQINMVLPPPMAPDFGKLRRREPDQPGPRIVEEKKEEAPAAVEEPKKRKAQPEHKEPREPRKMTETKKPIHPRASSGRVVKTAAGLTKGTAFEIANAGLIHVYDRVIDTLQLGIKAGNVDVPEGVLALVMFADLLHGGAYSVGIDQRPYHMATPSNSKYYVQGLKNADAAQGFLGWLASVLGFSNAGPPVQEIYQDANVPHVFPKMLSDDAYAMLLILAAHSANTEIFKTLGTGVTTFVEAAQKAEQVVAQTEKDVEGAINRVVTPLLKLVQAGVTLA